MAGSVSVPANKTLLGLRSTVLRTAMQLTESEVRIALLASSLLIIMGIQFHGAAYVDRRDV
jgi:hypothetical protein